MDTKETKEPDLKLDLKLKLSPKSIEALEEIREAWRSEPTLPDAATRAKFIEYLKSTMVGRLIASQENGEALLQRYCDFYATFASTVAKMVEEKFPEKGMAPLILKLATGDIASSLTDMISCAALMDTLTAALPQIVEKIKAKMQDISPEDAAKIAEMTKGQPLN